MKAPARAVFLDRDGVIVHEVDYLVRPSQLRLLQGSAQAIRRLRAAGYKTVVISNQSAVARGMLTRAGLKTITRKLESMLESRGARLDAIYYCPHHPEFTGPCACRKPGQALIEKARKRFRLNLKQSFFVGDTTTDMQAARRAGMVGLLVRTGYGGRDGSHKMKPAKAFKNLAAAAQWIINHGP